MAFTSHVYPRFSPLTAAPFPRRSTPSRRASAVAITAREARVLWRAKKAVFIDLSDWETIDETGWIEGSLHCPPGEFAGLIDPKSPLHTRLFEPGLIFIFYGGPNTHPLAAARKARALGLRSALALRGGLRAWRNAGGRVAGHPSSPLPALKASIRDAAKFAMTRLRAKYAAFKRSRAARRA